MAGAVKKSLKAAAKEKFLVKAEEKTEKVKGKIKAKAKKAGY